MIPETSRPPSFEEDLRPEQEADDWLYVQQPVEDLGRGETQGLEFRRQGGSEDQQPFIVHNPRGTGKRRPRSKMEPPYRDRATAAQLLSVYLRHYTDNPDVIVLGLPRGGVAVAHEVALALRAPMKALLVRKLRVPSQPELAFGAVCSTGDFYLDDATIRDSGITEKDVENILALERWELEKRAHFYGDHSAYPGVQGKIVIVVDDGIATGATMLAAARTLRQSAAARIVVAAPVGSGAACGALQIEADEVVCPFKPKHFTSVGQWYRNFAPVQDTEVLGLLRQHRSGGQRR